MKGFFNKDNIKILKGRLDLLNNIEKAREAIINKEYDKAKLYAKEALVMNSSSAEVENLLGVIEELTGSKKIAQCYYRAALDFDPTYLPAENNLKRLTLYNSGLFDIDIGEDH
ncbi:hypothetical protein [Clostridium sp.]|uniref:hypothetical protein n=1 Tax=Clostridium sp. TaxID=1506 RepID=UPI001DCAB0BC|nr:hypothetical protein [Clostridium sp.]MBS5940091.1 hypothetical protein [Clostridium sp.]